MSTDDFKSRAASGPQLDPRLLELLVCPLTKCTLVYRAEKQELVSRKAGLAYPIRNGVPLMTVEAARQLTDEEIAML
ncbi:MAG: Trm112 family protein [Deltaproteobacteria bacterium]